MYYMYFCTSKVFADLNFIIKVERVTGLANEMRLLVSFLQSKSVSGKLKFCSMQRFL